MILSNEQVFKKAYCIYTGKCLAIIKKDLKTLWLLEKVYLLVLMWEVFPVHVEWIKATHGKEWIKWSHLLKTFRPHLFANVENKSREDGTKQETVVISDVGLERRERNMKTSTFHWIHFFTIWLFTTRMCHLWLLK